MECPHCLKEIHSDSIVTGFDKDAEGTWFVERKMCTNPQCKKWIIYLVQADAHVGLSGGDFNQFQNMKIRKLVHPKTTGRSPAPHEVPEVFKQDYSEACLVIEDSAKASAALSRRCLQNLLREEAGIKSGNLAGEIQQVIDSKQLPSYLNDSIDALRVTGNFSAHAIKSESTGEIVEVEPGEAEWNLDVLESLFDFYFVQPAKIKEKRNALNKKLKDVGKPEMKKSDVLLTCWLVSSVKQNVHRLF